MPNSLTRQSGPSKGAAVHLLCVLLASLALTPSAMAETLIIQVRTEFTPITELGWVHTQFFELDGAGVAQPELAVMDTWTHHSISTSWTDGVRVGQSLLLPDADYYGNVSIHNEEGGYVYGRPVRVELNGNQVHVVTVLLTPDPEVSRPVPGYLPGTTTSHWTSEETDQLGDHDTEHSKDPIRCPPNMAMYGLGCNGNYCDNVQVFCRALPSSIPEVFRWTPYFSDENPVFEGCLSNEFATGIQCRGGFCDEIRLRCTDYGVLAGSCYATSGISEEPPWLTEFKDSGNRYVRRIQCTGNNCDNKSLEICEPLNWPLRLGSFSNLCVTSIAGIMTVGSCMSMEDGENTPQVWHVDLQTGLISNPLTGTCLTALGGEGAVTEELCIEAGDTFWFKDSKGRLSSFGPNNNPLCLGVAGVQDPFGLPPIGAAMELAPCSDALYQIFEPSNAALPPLGPEYDAGSGELFPFPVPGFLMPALLLLIGTISTVGMSMIRRR